MNRIGTFFFRYRNGLFPFAAVFVLIPSASILADDGLALALGLGVILVGQGLRAVTIGLFYIRRGGKDRRVYADDLVTEGMFAHCRNPLYVGNYLMLLGFGLAINSLVCLVGGGAFFAFAYYSIILAEEQYLRRSFGERFDEY